MPLLGDDGHKEMVENLKMIAAKISKPSAIAELYKHRHKIPKVRITRGAELRMRHFQSGLEPIYSK